MALDIVAGLGAAGWLLMLFVGLHFASEEPESIGCSLLTLVIVELAAFVDCIAWFFVDDHDVALMLGAACFGIFALFAMSVVWLARRVGPPGPR